MKKELELFSIDGSCGGNQDRMDNLWMKIGGCAALAAVDTCIQLTIHNGFTGICPINPDALNWESYNRFAGIMRPYLSPRMMGVNKLRYYTDGFGAYLRDIGCERLKMETLPMGRPAGKAQDSIKAQIDGGFPVPVLHLNAKTRRVKDYRWHWFLLTGYEETEDGLMVKAVTYGEAEWLSFDDLWHEDDPENGGLILYRSACPPASNEVVRRATAFIFDRADRPEKVLAFRTVGQNDSGLRFPSVTLKPGEDEEQALLREAAEKQSLPVTIGGLMTINEYDAPPQHYSERCYKAILTGGCGEEAAQREDLIWLSDEDLNTARWRPSELPLINIIRSELADIDAIRRRIAEAEAKDE